MMVNQVYEAANDSFGLTGRHRVLWINPKSDEAVTIAIPVLSGKRAPTYVGGPKVRSASGLQAAVQSGDLVPVTQKMTGIFAMSDAEIEARYGRKKNGVCKQIAIRDKFFTAIEPLLKEIRSDRDAFFADGTWKRRICEAANNSNQGRNQFYTAIHKHLAFGAGKNSQLPFLFRCGGRGKTRKQLRRLGRPSALVRCGLADPIDHGLSCEDKEKLAWGYRVFKTDKMSVTEAFRMTSAIYWSCGTKIVDGEELPILLPSTQRPTLAQFERWGPAGLDNEQAWQTLLGRGEFDSNFRALYGTAMDGINGIGQVGLPDATSIDLNLVSMASRLDPIGSATRLIIHDAWSSMICGLHCGLEAPSQEVALLAVLSAATSKVDLCKRYGVEISENDIPAVFFAKFLVDNGEFRTEDIIRILSALDSGMELVRVGQGELKGTSESGHRVMHKLTGHKLDGTTKGKQKKRGEDAPALHGCWRFHEYMRLLLKAIVYHNCEQRVEAFMNAHPYGTAMKADGVPPIRKAIFEWGLKHGLVHSPACNEDALRATLLPSMRALVKENGVFLIRPDVGRRKDLVNGHRFVGPRVTELKWMERARRSGTFEIKVKVDPNELTSIWFADDHGFHELFNQGNDLLLVQKGTLFDSLAIQDNDVIDRGLDRDRDDQAHSDFVVSREVTNEHLKREKQAEIAAQAKKPSKRRLTKKVKEHRDAERQRMAAHSNGGAAPDEQNHDEPGADTQVLGLEQTNTSDDWMSTILERHRDQ